MLTIFAVSDSIGETSEQVAQAAASQFDDEVEVRRVPYIKTLEDVEELIKSDNMLPEYNKRGLEQSKETINQLNMVSETIKDMANTYQEKPETNMYFKNRQSFITELLNNLDGLEDNMLYEDMVKPENEIVNELFDILLDKQEIDREDLLKTFAKFNNYIVQYGYSNHLSL